MSGTQTAVPRMSDLVNNGYISAPMGRGFLLDAGLQDMVWQVIWADEIMLRPTKNSKRWPPTAKAM